jgi:hypothetical protein
MAMIEMLVLSESDMSMIENAMVAYRGECEQFRDEAREQDRTVDVTAWQQTVEDLDQLMERLGDAQHVRYDSNGVSP